MTISKLTVRFWKCLDLAIETRTCGLIVHSSNILMLTAKIQMACHFYNFGEKLITNHTIYIIAPLISFSVFFCSAMVQKCHIVCMLIYWLCHMNRKFEFLRIYKNSILFYFCMLCLLIYFPGCFLYGTFLWGPWTSVQMCCLCSSFCLPSVIY